MSLRTRLSSLPALIVAVSLTGCFTPVAEPCRSDDECDDGDPSTTDSCTSGACHNVDPGSPSDGGPGSDAGSASDAGGRSDAGPGSDTGVSPDAGAPPDCSTPADCNDLNPATLDLCTAGVCSHVPVCTGPDCSTDPCKPNFPATGELRVSMLDVGQGDSIAIVAPGGCAALVDGGPRGSGATIKAHFAANGVSRLDFAVASHYHADHIGGLDEVAVGSGALAVRTVYDRGPASVGTQAYEQYSGQFSTRRQGVSVGQTFTLCDQVCFKVVQVNGAAIDDENARSVVLRMNHGRFSMLLGGDLTGSTPDLESGLRMAVGAVDVYKVHHHGSGTSSNPTFLLWLDPTVSLISVGWNNSYGHPHLGTVGRLQAIGSAIWVTEDDRPLGHIDVTVAGPTYRVSQAGRAVDYAVRPVP